MFYSAGRGVVCGMASALMLLLLGGGVGAQRPAQNPLFRNIELCNGADRSLPDIQIGGCTALIDSGKEPPQTLVIAYNNRGNAFSSKGEYDRAIQDYDQSIKLNPNYARAFNNRGVAYQKKGEYDRAMNDFDESIKLNPQYASAFVNRAQAYLNKGEYERAVRDYDEAIRLKPTLEEVWNGRCWTRAIVGELQAALADCNEALRLKPDVAATLDSRGAAARPEVGEFALWTRTCQAQDGRHNQRQYRYRRGKGNRGEHRRRLRTLRRALTASGATASVIKLNRFAIDLRRQPARARILSATR